MFCAGVRSATTGQGHAAAGAASPARLAGQPGRGPHPEDRHAVGVVGDLAGVGENAVPNACAAPGLRTRGSAPSGSNAAPRATHAQRVAETFDVRGGGPDAPARSLSGGNMQKLILGRALMPPRTEGGTNPPPGRWRGSPLVAATTRRELGPNRGPPAHLGLDIGAVMFVQQQLINAARCRSGCTADFDDLDEVLALGDRIGGDARRTTERGLSRCRLDARSDRSGDGGFAGRRPTAQRERFRLGGCRIRINAKSMRLEKRNHTSPPPTCWRRWVPVFTLLISGPAGAVGGAPVGKPMPAAAGARSALVFALTETSPARTCR